MKASYNESIFRDKKLQIFKWDYWSRPKVHFSKIEKLEAVRQLKSHHHLMRMKLNQKFNQAPQNDFKDVRDELALMDRTNSELRKYSQINYRKLKTVYRMDFF